MLLRLSQFFPFAPFHPVSPFPPAIHPRSSCPWVRHVSSLASPFPVLFLKSPCLFYAYHLFPAPFPPFSPFPFPAHNPPNDFHNCDSVPVLIVDLVCFSDSIIDSCEFIAILMSIVFIFFFLNKPL